MSPEISCSKATRQLNSTQNNINGQNSEEYENLSKNSVMFNTILFQSAAKEKCPVRAAKALKNRRRNSIFLTGCSSRDRWQCARNLTIEEETLSVQSSPHGQQRSLLVSQRKKEKNQSRNSFAQFCSPHKRKFVKCSLVRHTRKSVSRYSNGYAEKIWETEPETRGWTLVSCLPGTLDTQKVEFQLVHSG